MRLAVTAKKRSGCQNIRHCWRESVILPDDTATATTIPIRAEPGLPPSYDPIVNAENEVEAAFDGLTDTGELSSRNRMAIKNLLNPDEERLEAIMESTEEEIFEAVMKSNDAQEDAITNGGDDNVDDNAAVEDTP